MASGPAALATLRAASAGKPYRLVLLDMHMPDMDGETAAADIAADPRLAGTPIVLLSSMGAQADAVARRHLFAAALTKPVRQAHLLKVVTAVTGAAAPTVLPSTPGSVGRVHLGLRVLLAEDNLINRQVALQMLGRLGCRATAVEDGAQALAALERGVYDVVLMDVQMPVMNGIEATEEIRRRESETGRHLPIIVFTAHAGEGDPDRCLAAGMDGYVAKPVKIDDLARALIPYAPDPALRRQVSMRRSSTPSVSEAG